MRLILIRHGQTPANVAGQLDTAAPGLPLTELGRRQAAAVVPGLADEPVHGVYASDRTRAQETGAPIAADRGLDVGVLPGLGEIAAGEFEMRGDKEAIVGYLTCVAGWMRGDLSGAIRDGEDGHAFHARFDGAIREIAARHEPDHTVVAVAHGAAIRAWLGVLLGGVADDHFLFGGIQNTGGAWLEGDPDTGWELVRWSEEPVGGAHLEDHAAHDVTGESAEEAVRDAD
ncbi:MAG TPA: histidine phosphatase family protein [Nocardioides sp.]